MPFPGVQEENIPEAWEQFHTATMRGIAAMARCHVRQAAIHPRSYVTKEYDEDEEYARALQFLRPYCDEAARMGVELGIENMRGPGRSAHAFLHRFGMDIDVLIRLADELGQGICWDTGHGNISMQPQAKALRKIGRRITGDMDLDNDWDEYLAELNRMGLAEYQAAVQSAYDRMYLEK